MFERFVLSHMHNNEGVMDLSYIPLNSNRGIAYFLSQLNPRYFKYAAIVTRTILINPTEDQKSAYELSLRVLDLVISQLKPGEVFKNIYRRAKDLVQAVQPNLVPRLVSSLGHLTGLGNTDSVGELNAQSERQVQPSSTFVISAGFEAVTMEGKSGQQQPWAIWLADTVFVPEHGETKVFSAPSDISLVANMLDLESTSSGCNRVISNIPETGETHLASSLLSTLI